MSVNGTAPIAGDYNNSDLSDFRLSQNESDVNSKYSDDSVKMLLVGNKNRCS